MKKILFGVVLLSVACNQVNTDNESKVSFNESNIPIPTEMHERMEDEEGFESKKEGWIDLMHTAPSNVDWKEVNQQNFEFLMEAKRAHVQSRAVESFAGGNLTGEWVERGSKNQAGNLAVVDFEKESEQIYGVAANGAIWRSNLNGTSWTVLNDFELFDTDVIKVIELTPGNRRVLAAKGKDIWYSDDEGQSWQAAAGFSSPVGGGSGIDLVQLNDANNTILYLYNYNPLIGSSKNKVAYSVDNGETFIEVAVLANIGSNMGSMSHTVGSEIAYVLDRSANLYRFEGTALTLVNDDLGINALNYVKMVTSIDGGDTTIYILKDKVNLYKSVDAGLSFNLASTLPEPTWDVGIEVAEDDASEVYFGEVDLYKSGDGGQNFGAVSVWWEYYDDVVNKIHADIMDINSYVKNDGTEFTLIANHGGLSISYDHLQTTVNIGLDGLNIGQFYDVITSPINSNYVFVGTQDQGYQRGTNANTVAGLLDFEQVISGDYGHMQFSNDDEALWIQYPGASFSVYANGIQDSYSTSSYDIDGDDMPASDWIVPTAKAPNSSDTYIYAAGGNVTVGTSGSYMVKLNFDGNNVEATQFDFDFKADGGSEISALNASASGDDKLYVGLGNGKFYYSDDDGDSWTQGNIGNGPNGYWLYGAAIASSRYTQGLVCFGGTGYSNDGFYISTDGGENMVKAIDGLPRTVIHDLEFSVDENWIFAATEAGPYAYLIKEDKWHYLGGVTAPIVEYYSVEVVADQNLIRFGTHGRGIWDFNIETNSATVEEEELSELNVYPNLIQDSKINVYTSELGRVVVYDLNGRLVLDSKIYAGKTNVSHNLNNGMYMYIVLSETQVLSKGKIEVLR